MDLTVSMKRHLRRPRGDMVKRINKGTDENDFAALDKLAHGITFEKLRPLTAAGREGGRLCAPRRDQPFAGF